MFLRGLMMFNDNSVSAAIGRVKNSLEYSLEHKYGKEHTHKLADGFLRIHGLHADNFDFINNVETIIAQGVADASIDQNANKNEMTMAGIMKEATDSVAKITGYRSLYRKIRELYGKREAKRLTGQLYDFSLAISDSTKINLPYCYALDCTKIIIEGRPFGQLPSAPPKRLTSYIAALNETIHQLSNHTAGALAVGSFFLDVFHVLYYREGLGEVSLTSNKGYIVNCYQNFVHSVNHLSRNAVESPFTNLSIFDRPKLESLISDENMRWYFPTPENKVRDEWLGHVADMITYLQDIFMEFFDMGDPLNNGIPYRFPVVTINLSKKDIDNRIVLLDDRCVTKIAKSEIYRYNVLVSEGTKLASCCRLLSNAEMLEIGGQVNSFGGAGISLGSHRVVTINFNRVALEAGSYDDYKKRLIQRIVDSAKILKAHKELLADEVKLGILPFVANGYMRLERMFSTFGVLGIFEANETLKRKFGIAEDAIGESLQILNKEVNKLSIEYNIIGNIEQIPGETMVVKLCTTDKMLFGEEAVPYTMYTNQFVPLWADATIWERMAIDGKYNKLFTGGGIVHFNLGEHITSLQARKIINYAAESGCEHFALNSVYSKCADGHVSFGNHNECPQCQRQILEKFTRVVGFFVPVSSWNKTRREWEFPQRKFVGID
jgi:anaerobic ribonucleoside-triphosphate reductase